MYKFKVCINIKILNECLHIHSYECILIYIWFHKGKFAYKTDYTFQISVYYLLMDVRDEASYPSWIYFDVINSLK